MSLRRFGIASCLLVTGVLLGCGADDRTAEPVEGSVQAAVEGGRAEHGPGRHGPPGGPDFLLHAALNELDLSEAQESTIRATLDGLQAKREKDGPPDRAAFSELATEVRAGKVDATTVMAKVGNNDTAMAAHRADAAAALQKLHDTLDADQRRELVAAVKARVGEAKGPHGGPGARRGDGEGPPPPPDGAPPPDGPRPPRGEGRGHGRGPHAGGPAGFLFADLELTDAQQATVDAALEKARPAAPPDGARPDGKAMREAMAAKLQTFAADKFDATAFVAPPAGAPAPGGHVRGLVDVVAAVTPQLDAAQREKLAAKIEQGPPRPPGPKGGDHRAPAAK